MEFVRRFKRYAPRTPPWTRAGSPGSGGFVGIVVDSNVLVDLLAGVPRATAKVREAEQSFGPPFLSSIVIFETLVGVLFHSSTSKMRALESMLAHYPTLP